MERTLVETKKSPQELERIAYQQQYVDEFFEESNEDTKTLAIREYLEEQLKLNPHSFLLKAVLNCSPNLTCAKLDTYVAMREKGTLNNVRFRSDCYTYREMDFSRLPPLTRFNFAVSQATEFVRLGHELSKHLGIGTKSQRNFYFKKEGDVYVIKTEQEKEQNTKEYNNKYTEYSRKVQLASLEQKAGRAPQEHLLNLVPPVRDEFSLLGVQEIDKFISSMNSDIISGFKYLHEIEEINHSSRKSGGYSTVNVTLLKTDHAFIKSMCDNTVNLVLGALFDTFPHQGDQVQARKHPLQFFRSLNHNEKAKLNKDFGHVLFNYTVNGLLLYKRERGLKKRELPAFLTKIVSSVISRIYKISSSGDKSFNDLNFLRISELMVSLGVVSDLTPSFVNIEGLHNYCSNIQSSDVIDSVIRYFVEMYDQGDGIPPPGSPISNRIIGFYINLKELSSETRCDERVTKIALINYLVNNKFPTIEECVNKIIELGNTTSVEPDPNNHGINTSYSPASNSLIDAFYKLIVCNNSKDALSARKKLPYDLENILITRFIKNIISVNIDKVDKRDKKNKEKSYVVSEVGAEYLQKHNMAAYEELQALGAIEPVNKVFDNNGMPTGETKRSFDFGYVQKFTMSLKSFLRKNTEGEGKKKPDKYPEEGKYTEHVNCFLAFVSCFEELYRNDIENLKLTKAKNDLQEKRELFGSNSYKVFQRNESIYFDGPAAPVGRSTVFERTKGGNSHNASQSTTKPAIFDRKAMQAQHQPQAQAQAQVNHQPQQEKSTSPSTTNVFKRGPPKQELPPIEEKSVEMEKEREPVPQTNNDHKPVSRPGSPRTPRSGSKTLGAAPSNTQNFGSPPKFESDTAEQDL